jgi:hypothetical protein
VNVGDLVRNRNAGLMPEGWAGLLVDINPLRKQPWYLLDSDEHKITEIVVLLPDGRRWHADPADWEVVSESR